MYISSLKKKNVLTLPSSSTFPYVALYMEYILGYPKASVLWGTPCRRKVTYLQRLLTAILPLPNHVFLTVLQLHLS